MTVVGHLAEVRRQARVHRERLPAVARHVAAVRPLEEVEPDAPDPGRQPGEAGPRLDHDLWVSLACRMRMRV